jgi:hypothetical protein
MSNDQPAGETSNLPAVISAELAEEFATMASMIPSEDGAGYERILEALLHSTSLEQLNEPWETSKVHALAGRVLRIDSVTRRPSDFRDGLGVFLVVRGADVKTGIVHTITTGAISVVGQLVWAYAHSELPFYAEFVIAERATADGYHPHHLKIWGKPPRTDAGS